MAEYLHNTVTHLQAMGIEDDYLWRMQALVAERLARLPLRCG
jgi:cation transport protein ChaC